MKYAIESYELDLVPSKNLRAAIYSPSSIGGYFSTEIMRK